MGEFRGFLADKSQNLASVLSVAALLMVKTPIWGHGCKAMSFRALWRHCGGVVGIRSLHPAGVFAMKSATGNPCCVCE